MLWVGGQIVMHGIEEFGFDKIPHALHDLAHNIGAATPFAGGLVEWMVNATGATIFGVVLGAIVVLIHKLFTRKTGH